MTLGILYTCYSMDKEMIEKSLNPWIKYNIDNKEGHKVIISCCSCSFIRFPLQNNLETLQVLQEYKDRGLINSIFSSGEPISECEARNMPLKRLLELKVELISLWDSDEEITNEEIERLFNFLEKEKNSDNFWYRVNYRNLTFSQDQYTTGFDPARIFWANKQLLYLRECFDDNYLYYSDGWGAIDCRKLKNINIPQDVLYPKHWSWLNNNRSKLKCLYQWSRWKNCSFKWNDLENKLEFNLDYYKQYSKEIPILYNINNNEEQNNLVFKS